VSVSRYLGGLLQRIRYALSPGGSTELFPRSARKWLGTEGEGDIGLLTHWQAWESARRPELCLLSRNRPLQRIVAVKLQQDWSPQQIAGWLREHYPGDPEMWVSHETIYRSLFVQARGALKKELVGHLRTKRRYRRSRHATFRGQGRGAIIDAVSIRERPAELEDRAVPGHWEGDLVEGSRGTYIATLVERHSRFVVLVKLSEKGTEAVVDALIKAVRKLPTALRKSLTWDRGVELANHAAFNVATDVQVYFCDPSSPWQRGSNEKYERSAATVLSKRDGPFSSYSSTARCRGQETEHPSSRNTELENTSVYSQLKCFDDPLRPSMDSSDHIGTHVPGIVHYLCDRNEP